MAAAAALPLIVALGVYVYYFLVELLHLVEAAMGSQTALDQILKNATPVGAEIIKAPPETLVMLVVLGLIDVTTSNLLIMVIVGGYETFVSRMSLESHPDQPEWLSHVNASVLKVKLATAIIGISSIHLLKTFINAASYEIKAPVAQTVIHITFLLSALAIAAVDRIMPERGPHRGNLGEEGHQSNVADDPPAGLHPEHRGCAAVHLVLPPARLHHRAGRGLRGRSCRPAAKDAIAQILHEFADVC